MTLCREVARKEMLLYDTNLPGNAEDSNGGRPAHCSDFWGRDGGRWGAAVEAPLNILIGENYYQPAELLREQIRQHLAAPAQPYFERWIGLVELQILRSCIEPTAEMAAENPLWVRVQEEWRLPAD